MPMGSEMARRGLLGLRLPGSARNARAASDAEARELQTSLLPGEAPAVEGFQIACALRSSAEVSGDYFDVFPLNGGQTALCIADVSGKGMAAAILMRDLHDAVRKFAPTAASPAELCTAVNQTLCQPGAQTRYVTMFYGMLDSDKRLRYESAGHCLPLLVRADGSVEFPASFSGVIGIFSHWLYQNQELQLRTGDCLLLLTDGLLQAENRTHEEFGYQRLIAAVTNEKAESATALAEEILDGVTKFCGGKLQDDASLIVVRVN
jgi:phosphoserine phosphatase RsbU/P